MVKAELSSCKASCAGFKGAALRDMSRASRVSKSARRASILAEKPFKINAIYTRRFLGARHPLCGIGV